MKKLSLKSNAFDKGEVLTRTQLKKVIGGDGSGSGGTGGFRCRFKFKYDDNPNGSWSNWTEWQSYTWGSCEAACVDYINHSSNVAHCGFDTEGV